MSIAESLFREVPTERCGTMHDVTPERAISANGGVKVEIRAPFREL